MSKLPRSSRLASPVDTGVHGEYRITRRPDDPRPLYRFSDHVSDDPEAGRYHLYAGWFCPWSQRVTIAHALAGLEDVVSVSYIDNARDGRGWAFRERYGPDPVNGFTLLRQAYEATEPGFDGHISVPTLWDRQTSRVLSNDFTGIGIDFATRFGHLAKPVVETYPEHLRAEIEATDVKVEATDEKLAALDERIGDREHLVGGVLTEADIRVWVHLARLGPRIAEYPNLYRYARALYQVPAFRDTTDFTTYAHPDWSLA
ncbi:glutathione S-transferase C-terminal domain-containing protein [Dactylosporangium sp. NPDC051541]|uniref:glutathione S-transferase C-terminal domain-containing protein n=1 Tax=Dactylosporangium sp. NPDC051541 TaxID=3363977 RepID=UPI00379A3FA2